MAPRRVVLDMDVGTDDAVALYLLLDADRLGEIKIEAILCTKGNTSLECSTNNLVRLLETAGRTDIPVYRGSHNHLLPTPQNNINLTFHGTDGFGDLLHAKEPDTSIIRPELWISALHRLVTENPKEITLICLAPLTNIAISLRVYKDFGENLKDIYMMGGNYTALGNVTATSEFNFHCDPEAAEIVLECASCPITIVPWECCKRAEMTFRWRFDTLATIGGPVWKLITRAEQSVYKDFDLNSSWSPCDALLALAFLHPDRAILQKITAHVSVELRGSKTRGQVVLDHMNPEEGDTVIVEKIDEAFFQQQILAACKNEELHAK